jgi:hypothetical protein
MRTTKQQDQQRLRIAMAAAKHMSDSGVSDFQMAKRKACQQLAVSTTRNLPSNQEIKDALLEYQSLFKSDIQRQQIKRLRATAVEAMRFFQQFSPRLVGDVLAGYANEYTSVELHLFAEYPEQVGLFLMHEHIPYQEKQKRVSYGNEEYEFIPGFSFLADDVGVELLVFPEAALRRAPNSPVDGKPMQRADIKNVEQFASKA